MEYPDFASTKNRESFASHQDVLLYLEEYAKANDAHRYITFYHMVNEVKRESNCWKVIIKNLQTNEEFTRYYDVVLVCVGRYSKPSIPKSSDLSKFKGKILHSHHYRRPEEYENENVVVVGAGPSGQDIAIELVGHSKRIYLLHLLEKKKLDHLESLEQISDMIKYGKDKKIYTVDGLVLDDIDTVIFSTGYEYDYDFLHENVGIKLQENGKLTNVYLHLLNSLYPTMCLLAIPQHVLPFPMYHQQVFFYILNMINNTQSAC